MHSHPRTQRAPRVSQLVRYRHAEDITVEEANRRADLANEMFQDFKRQIAAKLRKALDYTETELQAEPNAGQAQRGEVPVAAFSLCRTANHHSP